MHVLAFVCVGLEQYEGFVIGKVDGVSGVSIRSATELYVRVVIVFTIRKRSAVRVVVGVRLVIPRNETFLQSYKEEECGLIVFRLLVVFILLSLKLRS